MQPESFCTSYQMATGRIKVLRIFEPPISPKSLRSDGIVGVEEFVRRNFQGKSFLLHSEDTPRAILALTASEVG